MSLLARLLNLLFFFFNDTATTEIYTLSLHDALPISILKEAARGLVPGEVIHRRKRGLSVPVARWLNNGLAPLADRLLDTPLLAEHRTGRRNHARRLWPQLMLALWSERWGVDPS